LSTERLDNEPHGVEPLDMAHLVLKGGANPCPVAGFLRASTFKTIPEQGGASET
jgi:hypothetical protein